MTVEIIASAEEARERADRIRAALENIAPLIRAAWERHDWEALGYGSWSEYVVGEFGGPLRLGRAERREAVAGLRSAGMSTRAIGAALGVTHPTVRADLADGRNLPPAPNGAPVPATVTGLDGKSYRPREEERMEATVTVIDTPRKRQLADAQRRRLETHLITLEGTANELNRIDVDRVAAVADAEAFADWARRIHNAAALIRRTKSRLEMYR